MDDDFLAYFKHRGYNLTDLTLEDNFQVSLGLIQKLEWAFNKWLMSKKFYPGIF